jgi:asparagine synthase (glutamine-hydrolysing)
VCGIAGIVSQAPVVDRDRLVAMRDTMVHRGPDAAGLWCADDRRVGLAHRRLAIIDLSPAGEQPMVDPSGDCHIVFNGEIYNFLELRAELERAGVAFHTASDTEVLLAAYRQWDVDCLSRLNGMFAFALFDRRVNRLLLARDRAGEKPLFYRRDGSTIAFASELKALMADPDCPRRLDPDALDHYLAFGYVPDDMCLLAGAHKLPQGHALVYDLHTGTARTWCYWRLPDAEDGPVETAALVEQLDRLLMDSVRLRLIADVPVGIMLSGGLDSSLVTAMAARVVSGRITTFNVSFPGHRGYDESPYARLVARHFGTEHIELAAEPATVDLLPRLARQYDEPIADSSMVPTFLVSQMIRREATVALGGDGGDELFGGYPHYSWLQAHRQMRRYLPSPLRRVGLRLSERLMPFGMRGRNYLQGLLHDAPLDLVQFNLYFDAATRRRLMRPLGSPAASPSPEDFRASVLSRAGGSLVHRATALDFQTYLVDDLLVKVDRASMLTSLEVRSPWLDHRLIAFAFGRVPDHLRATESDRKVLLRMLGARLLPKELDLTRKQGFSLPLASWFKGDWGRFVEEVLRDADPGLFDRRVIDRLIREQRAGLSNAQRLFSLTMFELWRREYRISTSARPAQDAVA